MLRSYFYSGWAFLIPYLAVYFLYYATNWPVNAGASANAGNGPEVRGHELSSVTTSPTAHHLVPCLLHVYWALHAFHVILASIALRSWLKEKTCLMSSFTRITPSGDTGSPAAGFSRLNRDSTRLNALLVCLKPVIPWFLLALIFCIPGAYLEWPSDPWEHLRRINEWRILDNVGAHSSWHKSAYFIPYSMLSWCIGLRQHFWLDFYYTGICLLLCWQYYRLSRACGLGERASMVFVILQALLFGNNIFSFYRYYAISSSIYAQLGAIAITRIVLEFAAKGTNIEPRSQRDTKVATHADTPSAYGISSAPPSYSLLTTRYWLLHHNSRPAFWCLPSFVRLLASGSSLLLLTAFNHQQGIGIACLGVAAIIIWRLLEWKLSALWWLIAGALAVNALFLWLLPRSTIIEVYRAHGWLNAWYGFNLLNPTSPAGDRMIQILGAFGIVNLAAALFLFRRNHVISWLVFTPFVLLLQPCISIPFATALSTKVDYYIITFQRMFFAIHLGLAPVYLGACCMIGPFFDYFSKNTHTRILHFPSLRTPLPKKTHPPREDVALLLFPKNAPNLGSIAVGIVLVVLTILLLIPQSGPSYNRIWHAIISTPCDLRMRDINSIYASTLDCLNNRPDSVIIVPPAAKIPLAYAPGIVPPPIGPMIGESAVYSTTATLDILGFIRDVEVNTPPNDIVHLLGHINPPKLISHPRAADAAAWITLGGGNAEFASDVSGFPETSTAIQNPEGRRSEVFSSALFPISFMHRYRLEISVRQVAPTDAIVYLAVAWYDSNGRLLESHSPSPLGGGNPHGWRNGTYSYFGLVAHPAPTSWSSYEIFFGLGQTAGIPYNARFVRAGGLLNYEETPSAIVQLTNLRLCELQTADVGFAIPAATSLYSPTSLAGRFSTHWSPQQALVDRGGTSEIRATFITRYPESKIGLCPRRLK